MTNILNLNKESVAEALKQGDATISTAEMNYLGISLTALFAEEGAGVIGCDTNPSIVNLINEGKTEIIERDLGRLTKQRVFGKTAKLAIITTDAVVGPPPDCPPDFSMLTEVCKSFGGALKKGDLP